MKKSELYQQFCESHGELSEPEFLVKVREMFYIEPVVDGKVKFSLRSDNFKTTFIVDDWYK